MREYRLLFDMKRPNIIFVLADQLRYQSCGYAGDPRARTPHIDRLAAQSVNFRQAVAAMPVCSAYREQWTDGQRNIIATARGTFTR